MNKKFILTLAVLFLFKNAFGYAPTNFYRPFEVDFRNYEWGNEKLNLRVGAFAEYGQTDDCRDWDENKNNVIRLYNQTESSLAMLLGAPKDSQIYKIANSLGVSSAVATSDDYRGKFFLNGEYEETNLVFFSRYKLPITLDGTFELSLFVPLKSMEFKNIGWCDLTKDVLAADKKFKDEISSKIEQKAKELGCLDINRKGWKKDGLGDISLILGWKKDYAQVDKEYLKNVRVNATVGVTIPTGEKKDVDQSLALPLGNDGAWGIPTSLGLDLDFIKDMSVGIDLSFLGIFDTTGTYRMRTSMYQTDFLLLHKGKATKSQGPSWKFTLYGKAKKIISGLSGCVSYHFLKHDADKLSPKSYDFDHLIINSAQSLQEWSAHSFVFQLNYDLFGQKSNSFVKPNISFFYKMPIAGKRAILAETFGGQIGFNF